MRVVAEDWPTWAKLTTSIVVLVVALGLYGWAVMRWWRRRVRRYMDEQARERQRWRAW